jgi:hypothetical protein
VKIPLKVEMGFGIGADESHPECVSTKDNADKQNDNSYLPTNEMRDKQTQQD